MGQESYMITLYYLSCNECDEQFGENFDDECDLADMAEKHGWVVENENFCYCPACVKKLEIK